LKELAASEIIQLNHGPLALTGKLIHYPKTCPRPQGEQLLGSANCSKRNKLQPQSSLFDKLSHIAGTTNRMTFAVIPPKPVEFAQLFPALAGEAAANRAFAQKPTLSDMVPSAA
jgi:hypothetical protein